MRYSMYLDPADRGAAPVAGFGATGGEVVPVARRAGAEALGATDATDASGATDASDRGRLLDALLDALAEVDAGDAPARATSLRIPEPVHRAVQLATELGMDGSMTAATTAALLDRVEAFARQRALVLHLTAHPEDEPALADVAARRVSGTGHPAVRRPDLVVRVADAVARRDPTWAREGRVDATIDRVLDLVELIDDVERSAVGPREPA